MATISKRGKFYRARIRRHGAPALSKTFDSKREAEAWARKIESEMDHGIFRDRSAAEQTTLAELLERYREEVAAHCSDPESADSRINVILNDPIADYSLISLTSKQIADFRNRRLKNVSGSTVKRDLALLSAAINVARKEWGIYLPENPVSLVTRPRSNPSRERRLMPGEEEKILAALEVTETHDEQGRFTSSSRNIWMKPLVIFAIETAMRRSDMLRLEGNTSTSNAAPPASSSARTVKAARYPYPPAPWRYSETSPEAILAKPSPPPTKRSRRRGSAPCRRPGLKIYIFMTCAMKPRAACLKKGYS